MHKGGLIMETENQKRKGINLISKILVVSLIPLALAVVISLISIRSVGVNVSNKLVKHELSATIYSMEMTLDALSEGDFSCTDGKNLYKGNVNITERKEVLDNFTKETDVDVTL